MTTDVKNNPQPQTQKKARLLSVDALRGFDMFWILGAEGIFAALFILTGWSFLQTFDAQMKHTIWHGITAYDLIFPLFIFLSGVSLGIAAKPLKQYPSAVQQQKKRHAHKRLATLLFLGVLYNHGWGTGVPMAFDEIRFASVLGRIAIAWYVAAMLVWYLSHKAQWIVCATILVGYYLLLSFATIGEYGNGSLTSTHAINIWFDQTFLPGATYQNLPLDPEGILSNIPSIVNAMAGVFIGRLMMKHQSRPSILLKQLTVYGAVMLLAGYAWAIVFPLNKSLWTSSFVLVTCGYSTLLLTLFYYVIDVCQIKKWAGFFAIIGTNSIVAYLATSFVNWQYIANSLFGGVILAVPTTLALTLNVVTLVMIQWLVLHWLYKRNIFIKV